MRRFPHLTLAAEIARKLGIVPTWPNVQTIRLAIESEALYSDITAEQAADAILLGAQQFILPSLYSPPSSWERREIFRCNHVDRFWFEDARWRDKTDYLHFVADLQRAAEAQ